MNSDYTVCRNDQCTTYPEGGDLSRGCFGSVEIPALSVDYDGRPFFNFKLTDELKQALPLLASSNGRISSFSKFKVSDALYAHTHSLSLSHSHTHTHTDSHTKISVTVLQALDAHKASCFSAEL